MRPTKSITENEWLTNRLFDLLTRMSHVSMSNIPINVRRVCDYRDICDKKKTMIFINQIYKIFEYKLKIIRSIELASQKCK